MRAIGRDPLFIARGDGAELIDVDGNRFVDYVCSWGPLIAGHAHPDVLARDQRGRRPRTSFGAPTAGEVELAAELARRFETVEMIRMTSSGTEAAMTAVRLARAGDRPRTCREVRRRLSRPLRRDARAGRLGPGDTGPAGRARRPRDRRRRDDRRAVERPGGADSGARGRRCRRDHRRAAAGEHGPRAADRGLPRAPAPAGGRAAARC